MRRRDLFRGVGLAGGLLAASALLGGTARPVSAASVPRGQIGLRNVYLELRLNGQPVSGDTEIISLGGVDVSQMIECISYQHSVHRTEGVRAGAEVRHGAVTFRKRIDRASPLLLQGFVQLQVADGTFYFFDTNPEDGITRHFFSLEFAGARIGSVAHSLPETLAEGSVVVPPLEEVTLSYHTANWTHVPSGLSFFVEAGVPGV